MSDIMDAFAVFDLNSDTETFDFNKLRDSHPRALDLFLENPHYFVQRYFTWRFSGNPKLNLFYRQDTIVEGLYTDTDKFVALKSVVNKVICVECTPSQISSQIHKVSHFIKKIENDDYFLGELVSNSEAEIFRDVHVYKISNLLSAVVKSEKFFLGEDNLPVKNINKFLELNTKLLICGVVVVDSSLKKFRLVALWVHYFFILRSS